MVIVNIQTYGDYDKPCTERLMKAPAIYTKAGARGLVARIQHEFSESNNVNAVIAELKKFDFETVEHVDLTIGRDL